MKRLMRAVVTDETGIMLVDKTLKGGTNNVAELWAITEALLFAKSCGIREIELYTDSKNSLAWVEGRGGKEVRERPDVKTLLVAIAKLRRHVKMTTTWVPREKSKAGIYIEAN